MQRGLKNEHSVGVDDHIGPRSGKRVSPVSPAGRQEKPAKNCHTEMNDVTVFLSVNKRFDLLAQKHGDYHLRTVKRNVGNNSRKKSLLEVHACLISEPK